MYERMRGSIHLSFNRRNDVSGIDDKRVLTQSIKEQKMNK
jgi:hypothetical protein